MDNEHDYNGLTLRSGRTPYKTKIDNKTRRREWVSGVITIHISTLLSWILYWHLLF